MEEMKPDDKATDCRQAIAQQQLWAQRSLCNHKKTGNVAVSFFIGLAGESSCSAFYAV